MKLEGDVQRAVVTWIPRDSAFRTSKNLELRPYFEILGYVTSPYIILILGISHEQVQAIAS